MAHAAILYHPCPQMQTVDAAVGPCRQSGAPVTEGWIVYSRGKLVGYGSVQSIDVYYRPCTNRQAGNPWC